MTDRAAHLVDHVFPDVPIRQYVLMLPPRLRYLLAWDHDLCRAVVAVYRRAVLGWLRRQALHVVTDSYTGESVTYAKDSSDYITGGSGNATNTVVTGDMTHLAGDRYIVIERDDFQGPPSIANPPRQKKLYLIDLNEVDEVTGVLKKRLLVDLLAIQDLKDIGGPLLEGLDNNYPGGNGRVPGTPDGTEVMTLRSRVPLRTLRVQPCKDASTGARNGLDQTGEGK